MLVRDARKSRQRPNVRLVEGDATDADAVRRAIAGADAVVSALGPTKRGAPDLMTQWTRLAIEAMRAEGVARIVVVSGAGAGPPPTQTTLLDRAFRFVIPRVASAPYVDKERQLRLLQESGLEWVAVRPPVIVEGAPTGRYRMGDVRIGTKFRVTTGDVADALLRQLAPGAPSRAMPLLAAG